MLRVQGTLIKDCPRGQDVAELRQNGTKRMPTLGGWKVEPKYDPAYTDGLPFGTLHPVAPVALKAGDVFVVDGETGDALRVERGDKVVWEKGGKDG